MKLAGVHARVAAGRHVVGLAVLDDTVPICLGHYVWKSPVGESAANQLNELYVRAHELLERNGAEALVSWTSEPSPGGAGRRAQLIEASRAEGAAMAAAGAVATVTEVAKAGNATVHAAAGLGADTAASVAALCSPVSGLSDEEPVRRAAALAWAQRA